MTTVRLSASIRIRYACIYQYHTSCTLFYRHKVTYSQGRIYSKPGPVQKKCAPNTIIGLLLAPTVPSITQNFYLIYYFNDFRAISVCWHVAEFFCSSCGGPIFVGVPVRPNMLNMPKSASAYSWNPCKTRQCLQRHCICSRPFRCPRSQAPTVSKQVSKWFI